MAYLFVENSIKAERVFEETPRDHLTSEIKIAALKENGLLISKIPDATYDMCKIAVEENPSALSKCPKKLIDYELCVMAVCNTKKCKSYYYTDVNANLHALERCPSELLDDNLCRLAVKADGMVLCIALKKLKGSIYELCKIAVEQNGLALKQCPYDIIDYELCRKALSQNPMALEYCPSK